MEAARISAPDPAAAERPRAAATAAHALLALQRAAGNRAVTRVLARKAECPSAAAAGLRTTIPKGQPAQCSDPTKRRCYEGPTGDITGYFPDGEGGYLTCTYQQSTCECYDKDPSLDYYEGIWNLWGLWGGKAKRIGAYNTWSLKSDAD